MSVLANYVNNFGFFQISIKINTVIKKIWKQQINKQLVSGYLFNQSSIKIHCLLYYLLWCLQQQIKTISPHIRIVYVEHTQKNRYQQKDHLRRYLPSRTHKWFFRFLSARGPVAKNIDNNIIDIIYNNWKLSNNLKQCNLTLHSFF